MPLMLFRRLGALGVANAFVMLCTIIAIGISIYYSAWINNNTPAEDKKLFSMNVTTIRKHYSWFDIVKLPVFLAGANSLYEGNMVVLNFYSETDEPKKFYGIFVSVLITYTIVIGVCGYMGYFAFGQQSKDIILLNMPLTEPLAVTARILYLLTISGSFILLI
jgi:amino acid permease